MPQAAIAPAIGVVGNLAGSWLQGRQQNKQQKMTLDAQSRANQQAMAFEIQKENQRRQMTDRARMWANQRYGGGDLGSIMMKRTPRLSMPRY